MSYHRSDRKGTFGERPSLGKNIFPWAVESCKLHCPHHSWSVFREEMRTQNILSIGGNCLVSWQCFLLYPGPSFFFIAPWDRDPMGIWDMSPRVDCYPHLINLTSISLPPSLVLFCFNRLMFWNVFTFGCTGSSFLHGLSLAVESRGYSLVAGRGLLTVVASLAAEHGL